MAPCNYKQRVLPRTTRLLAIAAAFVGGIAFSSLTWLLSLLALPLIFASIIQPHLPRLGRVLMWVFAPLMSVYAVPIGTMFLWEIARGMPFPHDRLGLAITSSWLLSLILFVCCDFALLSEAINERRSHGNIPPAPANIPT